MSEQLLTVKEAAGRLSVGTSLVYDLVAARRLRSCRIGKGRGVIRIPESALAEYLESVTMVVAITPRRSPSAPRIPEEAWLAPFRP